MTIMDAAGIKTLNVAVPLLPPFTMICGHCRKRVEFKPPEELRASGGTIGHRYSSLDRDPLDCLECDRRMFYVEGTGHLKEQADVTDSEWGALAQQQDQANTERSQKARLGLQ